MASNPPEMKEATEPKAAPDEPETSRKSRRGSEKDTSRMEKPKKGRRGSDKERSLCNDTRNITSRSLRFVSGHETLTKTERDREGTEKSEKEGSKVSRKSSGSTRSKGSRKSSAGASKKPEREGKPASCTVSLFK
ncbi:hypothetical protein MTO96_002437 [Rhipicephalus appendiculatus]